MQIFVRSDRTAVISLDRSCGVAELISAVEGRIGIPAAAQVLLCDGRQLSARATLVDAGVTEGATVRVTSRLVGGSGRATLKVRPRLQRERWSLYWKETMATQTQLLEDVEVQVDLAATGAQVLAEVASRVGWQPVGELLSLEGFEGPWERLLVAGREVDPTKSLAEQGVADGDSLVAVRLALAAEGWKLEGGEDDSSEDDEAAWDQVHPHQVPKAVAGEA